MHRTRLVLFGLSLATLAALALSKETDPYASRGSDPFAVLVTSTPAGSSGFTVQVTVTDKSSGKVVFAPRVTTRPRIPAEIFSEPDERGVSFEVRVTILDSGKASVIFKAYKNVLQRSHITS